MCTQLQVHWGHRCVLDRCMGSCSQWATAGPLMALCVAQSVEFWEFWCDEVQVSNIWSSSPDGGNGLIGGPNSVKHDQT